MKLDNKKLLYVIVGLIVVLLLLLLIVSNTSNRKEKSKTESVTYSIMLKGSERIVIKKGEQFVDPGYEVLDNTGFVVNGVARVENNIDYNKPGKYTVRYIINGDVVATREVIVEEDKKDEPVEPDEKDYEPILKLVGGEEVNVLLGTEYIDTLYTAKDANGNDYSEYVTKTGRVDTSVEGKYELKYNLKKDNINESAVRVVNVITNADVKFELVGDIDYKLEKGKTFSDPGFIATVKADDYSSNVKVESEIDNTTIGKYKVVYTFKTEEFVASLIRNVEVIAEKKVIDFRLDGAERVELTVNESYNDPGFIAKDQFGNDYSGYVTIENYLDVSNPGTYKIKFHLRYEDIDKTVERIVVVTEKPSDPVKPDDNSDIDFHLNGSSTMSISVNTPYSEPGVVAKNSKGDLSYYVTMSGSVNYRKVGTYSITYTLKYGNYNKTLVRTVKVTGTAYSVSQTKNSNNTVTIKITSNVSGFSHYMGPHFTKYNTDPLNYTVSENGTYTFYLYDKSGVVAVIDVKVTSIVKVEKDTTKPKGTCKASVNGGVTKYVVKATDAGGIKNYKHNGKTYSSATFTVNNDVEDDTVRVTDKAGNYIDITCEYSPISSGNKSVIASYSSDTLKYWIEKPNTNYTVTHIWVKDAYSQMNVAVNTNMGTLETTKTMVDNTISKYGYSKKGMVAINASGFIMSAGDSYENYVKAYRLSSRAPVIFVRGNLVRDFTSYSLPNAMYPVYGLKKNGYLASYSFGGGSGSVSNNKKVLNQMKSDGIRNTASFPPVLVSNYKAVNSSTDHNLRQAICQIDRNNFVIVTNVTSRSAGWNFKDLSNYMVSLNCRTGYNLDGGGSINLYYKKNSSNLSSVTTSGRRIADILYFVEK